MHSFRLFWQFEHEGCCSPHYVCVSTELAQGTQEPKNGQVHTYEHTFICLFLQGRQPLRDFECALRNAI